MTDTAATLWGRLRQLRRKGAPANAIIKAGMAIEAGWLGTARTLVDMIEMELES